MAIIHLGSLVRDYIGAIIFTVATLCLIRNRFKRRLNSIPGPFFSSISSLPRLYSVYRGKSHENDILLHRKYGPVVRVAPNTLSISDPEAVNTLYGIGTKFYKSAFYKLAEVHDQEGVVPDPFVLTNKEMHSRMKKNGANAFSMNGLVHMEPWIEPVTERLFTILDNYAESKKSVDVAPILKDYAMDAVCSLTFGRDFDHLNHGDHLGLMKIMDIATAYMVIFGQIPWTHRFLLANSLVTRLVFGNNSGEAELVKLAEVEVEEGMKGHSEDGPMTFLRRLVLNQKNNPKSITHREIVCHAFGNVAAGSDTTAIALRSILFNVVKHPAVYDKLCAEVRTNLTLPVKWNQAKDLPYLTAVIKEGIRYHPSVGMILARIVPYGGTILSGHELQPGVEVGINPWVMHRNPEVFVDPDRFWPERWLEGISSEDHLRVMQRSFLAFGHGAHTCSGRWISTMEVQKLIPSLLLRYDMALSDGGKGYKFENLWFTPQTGVNVIFTKR